MEDVTLNIWHNANQAAPAVRSLSNEMGRMAQQSSGAARSGNAAASGFSRIGKACLSAGKSATRGASGLSKFVSSIGRIAFYRAIRSAIRYVTDSFRHGLEAAYNWSKEQGGANAKLAAAMDNLSAASGRMKLQLGAAFGGLIVAIEPILTRIINLVTAAADAVTRFFAVLNGSGYYKKAVGGFQQMGSAAGGANKQIKGLLASWDELTVIGKESGGGGGGSSNSGYTGDYEWAEAESPWADLFKSGSFFEIGQRLNEGLAGILTKFDEWLGKVRQLDLGKKVAEIVNGFFAPNENGEYTTFKTAGETVADGLIVIIEAIGHFLENVNWEDIKESIKAFVEGFSDKLEEEFGEYFKTDSGEYKAYWDVFIDGLLGETNRNRLVLEFQMLWNDLKISAATGLRDLLELFHNEDIQAALDYVGLGFLGLGGTIQSLNEYIDGAKEKGASLEEQYDALTKQLSDTATATNELNGELTTLDGQNPEVNIDVSVPNPIEANDLFSDRPLGHGKQVGEGKAYPIEITATPTVGDKINTEELFSGTNNEITSGGLHGTTLALGILPHVTLSSSFIQDREELASPLTVSVTPKLTKTNFGITASLTNSSDLTNAVKNAMKTKVEVTVSGGGGKVTLQTKALGGFVDSGQLFIAREAGPEMVGTIGGSTAVANNDQIVAGIQHGVQSGMAQANAEQNELLRQQNSILMRLLQKDSGLSPSVGLGQVMAKSAALYGRV